MRFGTFRPLHYKSAILNVTVNASAVAQTLQTASDYTFKISLKRPELYHLLCWCFVKAALMSALYLMLETSSHYHIHFIQTLLINAVYLCIVYLCSSSLTMDVGAFIQCTIKDSFQSGLLEIYPCCIFKVFVEWKTGTSLTTWTVWNVTTIISFEHKWHCDHVCKQAIALSLCRRKKNL